VELSTVGAPPAGGRSQTMADLGLRAVAQHAGKVAQRYRSGDAWVDIRFQELETAAREVALGLLGLGIAAGERVAILSNTRPEWTQVNLGVLATGAVCVSVYQTNSPEECRYVLAHSETRAVFVEDAEQLAKIRAVRAELPALEHVVVIDPDDDASDAIPLAELRAAGRRSDRRELEVRAAAVAPDDACVYMYTSGTTGPPKACILTHGNYRTMVNMVDEVSPLEGDELIYLYLPLAHAFALLIQFVAVERGITVAYWEKDPQKILPNLVELKPTYFPSVPRVFEKIYALARAQAPDPDALDAAIAVGFEVRELEERGEEVPPELRERFERADEALFGPVRALFGGRMRQCVTGAAPIAVEILKFFYACGIPIYEGYGMTETATAATSNRPGEFRFGSVGRPFPGVQVRIADDGEILVRGPNIFRGYYKEDAASAEALAGGWLHTGDLGRLDDDGYLYVTGRKKDIIITAGGKNITPANLENGLKASRWISQAVVVGDRRPYLVALITLDPEELAAFAAEHGLEPDKVPQSEAMRHEIARLVEDVNTRVGRVEQIKRFTILPEDFSQAAGELTPTLKVKRNVVGEKYADEIAALYA
jgi:long-chain acyl-CoA synthetase